ncbi:MAG: rod shape-determining protein MreD [Ignavibacteriae bacterium]|nr:rod shape-determining protein MreD [Ignavibacteria bacterium]MBI3363368.1 rod shape-determining protein MreD [Ignavibacteriota bacterium]
MISRAIKYVIFTVILVILQTKLMRLLSLEGITPDILTIWIVYIALKEGQLPATIWGFCVGLFFDFVTGNFIGLAALTKTVCGFTAGYFYNENKTTSMLSSYRFLIVVLVVSFIHNTAYFIIYTRGTDIGILQAVLQFGLATTFYTTTWSLLPMFAFARKYLS